MALRTLISWVVSVFQGLWLAAFHNMTASMTFMKWSQISAGSCPFLAFFDCNISSTSFSTLTKDFDNGISVGSGEICKAYITVEALFPLGWTNGCILPLSTLSLIIVRNSPIPLLCFNNWVWHSTAASLVGARRLHGCVGLYLVFECSLGPSIEKINE